MSRIQAGDLGSKVYEPACMRVRDAALGLAIVVAVPYSIMVLVGGPIPQWLSISGFLIAPSLFLVLYPVWAARRCGAELLKWPGAGPVVREAGIGSGIGVATMLLLGSIELALFGKVLEFPEPIRQLIVAQDTLIPIIMCVLALTFIPLGEELFYRGLIYGALRRLSVPGALVAQAFVFALLHHYDLTYSIFIFVGGIVFGIVYEWRRTLWAPIFMHLTCIIISLPLLFMAFIDYANTPMLGAALENHDDGCRITRVLPKSSAEEAGLKVGDVILSLGDQPTSRPDELIAVMEKLELGSEVKLEIQRSGKRMTLEVSLNQRRQ